MGRGGGDGRDGSGSFERGELFWRRERWNHDNLAEEKERKGKGSEFLCFASREFVGWNSRGIGSGMPPKGSTASRAKAAAAAARHAAAEASETAVPLAEALPLEPMDLDETDTTAEAEHDIEMLDVKPVLPAHHEESPPPPATFSGKGKGKQVDQQETMTGLQNVADVGTGLGGGMEGMDEPIFKGKGLTDSIKNVQVRLLPPPTPSTTSL